MAVASCFGFVPKWKRPENIPVGRIWFRFPGKDRDGSQLWYQIRDYEPQFKEACLNLIQNHMFEGDQFYEALNLNRHTVTVNSMRDQFVKLTRQNMSLVGIVEKDGRPNELVAFNFLVVKNRREMGDVDIDYDDNFSGEEWKKLLTIRIVAEEMVNIHDIFKVKYYLSGGAMTVHLNHRDQNLEIYLLQARDILCQEFKIEAVASVFYTEKFQIMASNLGYQVLAFLPYTKMEEYDIVIENCGAMGAKFMGKKITLHTETERLVNVHI